MVIFLALQACLAPSASPDAEAAPLVPEMSTPTRRSVAPPSGGRAVLRTCDLGLSHDVLRLGGITPPPPVARDEEGLAVGRGGLVGGAAGGGYGAARSTRAPSAPVPVAAPSAKAAENLSVVYSKKSEIDFDSMSVSVERGAPMADLSAAAEAPAGVPPIAGGEHRKESLVPALRDAAAAHPRPNLDWGATVYLSNDDSMSLASAQRLLWSVQQRASVSASQIRPHELLNYFGFETVKPAGNETFGVVGSARQTASDTLSLAFAVEGATPERQPLDLTIVLDRSGSMSAEGRMDYLKRGLRKLSGQLHRGDRVNLVLFDHEVCNPLENYVHGRDDSRLLTGVVDALQPRGSTDLDLGLKEGYRLANAQASHGRNDRVLLISDALLNTGDIRPGTVTEVASSYDKRGVRLSAVGVGRDFNDQVLDMLSEKGKGAYVYLGSEAVVDRIFGAGFDSLVQTVAHDVQFSVDLPPSLAMTRFYGKEASTRKEDVQPIHYYAGTKQLFLQDVAMRDGHVVPSDVVTFHVAYTDAGTGRKESRTWDATVGDLLSAPDHNLRKGRALMAWTDLQLARAMGGDACGAPWSAWEERASLVEGDAELAWLDGITAPLCGGRRVSQRPVSRGGVAFKLRVDSDVPIAEVALDCGNGAQRQELRGGGSVASFASVPAGSCTVTLDGVVPMFASVQIPEVGGQATCRVRGGRLGCS